MPESAYFSSVLLLLGAPFLTFIMLWIAGGRLNRAAGWVGAAVTLFGLALTLWSADLDRVHTGQFTWLHIGELPVTLTYKLDALATMLLVIVHFVALLVQIYSTAYLSADQARYRYFAFLQLFLFSMIGIVFSGSLLMMYIFWELVGLCSYLLIGFWYHKPRAVWAAQKAFVMNRIGDAAFLTGILMLFYYIGSTDFEAIKNQLSGFSPGVITAIGLLLFGGCMGKSAQFPLSGWLPDAMEGPTPVSALIHAATMVAAGIFLMARISFMLTPDARFCILTVGLLTMLHGAWKATNAWDIKGVLAFSTMSQLGLMVVAIGLGSWHTAIFHLTTHAFFKAGLFLSAGSVIHAVTPSSGAADFDPQDMRTMGGLRKKLPVTFICFALCAAALAGLPLFSGFLSKDAIVAEAFLWAEQYGALAYAVPVVILLSAGLTAYYMARQIWVVFLGEERYKAFDRVHPHEGPWNMWLPMILLAGLSVFVWFSFNPFHAGESWYLFLLGKSGVPHISWLPFVAGSVSVIAVALAFLRTKMSDPFGVYSGNGNESALMRFMDWTTDFERGRFFIKSFTTVSSSLGKFESQVIDAAVNLIAKISVVFAHLVAWMDKHIVDGGVSLAVLAVRSSGQAVRKVQNGRIQSYFVASVVGVFLLIIWIVMM